MSRAMDDAATKTVLITAVGSGVGQSILQSLQGRRERLRVLGSNSLAEAPELFHCDAAWLLPPNEQAEEHRRQLQQLIEAESPDLVVPGRDDDVLVLAALREARPEWAPRLLVGSLAAARVMDHKALSAAFAQAYDLPFVPTVSTDAPDAKATVRHLLQQHGFPLIAKPASGNGSRGVRVLLDESQLERVLARPGQVLQPMVDAPAELQPDLSEGVPLFWGVSEQRLFAVRGWIAHDGQLHPGCAYVMTMVTGRFERMAWVDDEALHALGMQYGRALSKIGWRGPFHLQCKLAQDARYLPIELNGRLGGGTAGRQSMGYDEVADIFNHWLGSALGGGFVPPHTAPRSGLVISRPVDRPLSEDALTHLRSTGRWLADTQPAAQS